MMSRTTRQRGWQIGALSVLLALISLTLTCGRERQLPQDPDLARFIEAASRCAYLDRAYSHDADMLQQELADVDLPKDWDGLVDSLLSTYGADPDFWYKVYQEIEDGSRR
jgi:hypothetical protein